MVGLSCGGALALLFVLQLICLWTRRLISRLRRQRQIVANRVYNPRFSMYLIQPTFDQHLVPIPFIIRDLVLKTTFFAYTYFPSSVYLNSPLLCAPSTFSLKSLITLPGSSAVNVALPATMTLLPASAAPWIVFGPIPPSTSMSKSGYRVRKSRTLEKQDVMHFWPPNPGSTV